MTDSDSATWAGPLEGIRVLDFTRVLSGPSAALALADLGAEVLKIEPPGGGDETRSFPPFRDGESHYYISINRGKKSIVVDLKTEQGIALARDLAAKSDVLLENYRPGVMDRLGLSYKVLAEDNPGLIYCAISGFGMDGPLHNRPSFDIVLQALSGAMSVNGEPDGGPTKMGIPLGDLIGGINGPIAILGALHERHRTGRGRLIDISLLDGMLGMLGYLGQLAFFNQENPTPLGSQHPNLIPYGQFPANDGAVIVACLTNAFWGRLCAALNRPELGDDPRFNSLEKRRERRDEVNKLVADFTSQHSVAHLTEVFTQHQVPNAPILGVLEALSQPQAKARNMVVETEHPTLGSIPIVNRSIRYADVNQAAPSAPPTLGQHTDEILADVLGLDADAISSLRSAGVVS